MSTDADPRATVSLAAIVANVHASGGTILDLRRDARGHGLAEVARAVLDATDVILYADESDAVRIGVRSDRIRTSGAAPDIAAATAFGVAVGFRPALTLRGTVLSTKALKAGEGVSYGYAFRAPADTRVALVTGGYAQGIPRSLGNRVSVSIGGAPHPIVGRIAMDVCVVEIADTVVARGDRVTFVGDPDAGAPSVAPWARESGLTPLEIVTGIGLHTRREYER